MSRHNPVSFMYMKLKRYEVHREHAVYNLLPSGYSFLDVGCGEGNLVLMAKSKFEEVYGCDISRTRIMKAQSRSQNKHVHFFQCDVEKGLPFRNSSFDAIACVAVLQCIVDLHDLFDEFKRVLRVRGSLVIEVPNFAWLPRRLELLTGKLPSLSTLDEFGLDKHFHNFTASYLCNLLKSKGLEILDKTTSGVFAECRGLWLSFLGGNLIVKSIKSNSRDSI